MPDPSTVLLTRLKPPANAAHHVRRARLLDVLDDSTRAPLTLLVAPAGSGKTVLLSSWAAESTVTPAWLSIDDAEHQSGHLWDDIAAALRAHPDVPVPGSRPGGRPDAADDAVAHLLNELEGLDCPPTVLVLDDVHLVEHDAELWRALGRFLQHLPAWLHVVASSRRNLALPIDRLRARGTVRELRFADLRFADDEAAEMLDRLSPDLHDDQVRATVAYADGWAAGLHLAAVATRTSHPRDPEEHPGGDGAQMIVDYISREVLADEDPLLAQVLVGTSVVARMNTGLAQALTGRTDARALLDLAEARGLFVSRLGSDGDYEVHAPVRDALATELARSDRDRLTAQHGLAAAWFEAARQVPEALEHYLAAERPRDALRLLAAEHARLYDARSGSATVRTLEQIPADLVTGDLEALLEYAWCHLLVSRRRFTELVDHATWMATTESAGDLRPRLDMLRSISLTANGEWNEGGQLARRVVHDVGADWWRDPVVRFGWNVSCRDFALSERWDESVDEILDARHALVADPDRLVAMEGTRALGLALAGHPIDALRIGAGVEHATSAAGMAVLGVELALATALAHRELGDADRADEELRSLAQAPADVMVYAKVHATIELAHAHVDEGNLDEARTWLDRAGDLIDRESFGSGGRRWRARAEARLALSEGDLTAARAWVSEIDDQFWSPVTEARVLLADGDRAAAIDHLERATTRCVRHEVVAAMVRSQLLADTDAASKQVALAAEQAAGHGLLQTIAAEGRTMVERVELVSWNVTPSWMDRLRRVTAGHIGAATSTSLDDLTARERELLRYLQSRLTNREIAAEMYISLNTLKSHLKCIYRKLDVGSRSEAVRVAQAARQDGR